MKLERVCICGGGSLGHVIAGWLSAMAGIEVTLLTGHPEKWNHVVYVTTPEGSVLEGALKKVSSDPKDVIPGTDVVLICLPGYLIADEIRKIMPYVGSHTFVGSVFSSTGFFFEAMKIFAQSQPLWGFQRVPFIARVTEYGVSANLLGYKESYNIAVEHVGSEEKQDFCKWVEHAFGRPVHLLCNYLEASLTNSNPILHTSRLYTMFSGWKEGITWPAPILFYESWDVASAERLIAMDCEFFHILDKLPVTPGYLPTILDYYESHDAESLAAKLSNIKAFKGILSPMKQVGEGWIPDFSSRYFTEDFPYGLRYIYELGMEHKVQIPEISRVLEWGLSVSKFFS